MHNLWNGKKQKGFSVSDRFEYDQVRVQILGEEKISSLEEAYSNIKVEKNRRVVILKPQLATGSAMISAKSIDGRKFTQESSKFANQDGWSLVHLLQEGMPYKGQLFQTPWKRIKFLVSLRIARLCAHSSTANILW